MYCTASIVLGHKAQLSHPAASVPGTSDDQKESIVSNHLQRVLCACDFACSFLQERLASRFCPLIMVPRTDHWLLPLGALKLVVRTCYWLVCKVVCVVLICPLPTVVMLQHCSPDKYPRSLLIKFIFLLLHCMLQFAFTYLYYILYNSYIPFSKSEPCHLWSGQVSQWLLPWSVCSTLFITFVLGPHPTLTKRWRTPQRKRHCYFPINAAVIFHPTPTMSK